MTHTPVLLFAAPADAPSADLDTVGGKGLSLARLTAAGFPVPAGFAVTTAAYRQFVADNDRQQTIIDLVLAVPGIGVDGCCRGYRLPPRGLEGRQGAAAMRPTRTPSGPLPANRR